VPKAGEVCLRARKSRKRRKGIENYSSPKLGEVPQSGGEVCLRARKSRKSRKSRKGRKKNIY
jgi:hypothetical protein